MEYELLTERLRLYAPSIEEIDQIQRGECQALSQTIGAHIPEEWPTPELLEGIPVITAEMRNNSDLRWVWMIIDQATSQAIGDVGFHGPPLAGQRAEIGYALLPGARGKGYATEATGALIRWAFANMQVAEIIAQIDPANAASLNVAAKLGMQPRDPVSAGYLCFGIAGEQE